MKTRGRCENKKCRLTVIAVMLMVWTMAGCTAVNPRPEQLELPVEPPAVRQTSFSDALARLGVQSEIYGTKLLKIQCREVDDLTGTSYHSGGEIPRSITVMVKTALNAIGGRVVYIPFWPDYFAGIQVSGYPVSDQKLLPDVILSGGITEFDRGLTTLDRTRNLDTETKEFDGAPSLLDGKNIGLDYSRGDKWGKAKIAVDFNLVSYQALCGIPKMQASNGITVYKGITEEELGFTLFGPTIGLRGSVKKVQGRHDAVRLLVQFSIIQLVGRYLDLPYWRLLDGVQPDPVVTQAVADNFLKKPRYEQILCLKRMLWLHGHPVAVNHRFDNDTRDALANVVKGYDRKTAPISADTFLDLYVSVPVTGAGIERAARFDERLTAYIKAQEAQKPLMVPKKSSRKTEPMKKEHNKPKTKKIEKDLQQRSDEPRPQTPAPDIIIITPLDAQTHHTLNRIIRRIGEKHKHHRQVQPVFITGNEKPLAQ